MKKIFWRSVFASTFVVGTVFASSFNGAVDEIAIAPSQTQSGYARVSVRVTAHSSPCGNPLWFAYEYSNNDIVGKTWTALLAAIKEGGQSVRITGTGTCDGYGVENIMSVNLL